MKGTAYTAVAESRRDSSRLGEGRMFNHLEHADGMAEYRDPFRFALAFALETDEETWQRVCRMYGLPLDTPMSGTYPFAP